MKNTSLNSLPSLPIDHGLPQLLKALSTHPSVVLCAPPGSGKTTRVPLSLLDSPIGEKGLILMLEPRRVAARSVAGYMARMLGEPVGQTVGYQIRMARKMSAQTRVLVVTEGLLTRRFLDDPLLENVSCVIVDEFHERSVHADLALCLLKEAMSVRDDLKIVVMSATINTDTIAAYLNDCPVVEVGGAPYPLRTEYRESRTDYLSDHQLIAHMKTAIVNAISLHAEGDVLAFLPGASDIRRLCGALDSLLPTDIEVVPLYGALSAERQDDAVKGGNRRRVVLATNIAETSLTIPNVRIVVDSGLENRIEWRSGVGFEKLVTGRISQFSAIQRAGRAARTGPGTVYRLWHSSQQKELPPESIPELRRVDPLTTVFTLLATFCRHPDAIDLLTPLQPATVLDAMGTLRLLGLVHGNTNRLTDTGQLALRLPVHPRLALIIIAAAHHGDPETGALAAAILEERQMFRHSEDPPTEQSESCDVALRIRMLQHLKQRGATSDVARQLGVNLAVCQRIWDRQKQLFTLVRNLPLNNLPPGNRPPANDGDATHFLLAGFWDRVCKKSTPHGLTGVMATGRGVSLGTATRVRQSPVFLAIDAIADTRRSNQRSEVILASGISGTRLEREGKAFFSTDTELEYDAASGKVLAFERTRYMNLLWHEKRLAKVPPHLQKKMLLTEILTDWTKILFANPEQKNALARLAFAHHFFNDLNIPPIHAEGLTPIIEAACTQSEDIASLKTVDYAGQLIALLPFAQQQSLKSRCPVKVPLPSGRSATVDYTRWYDSQMPPIIRVRLQELFGLKITPQIAEGRIALSIALLAPNGREVQITDDLHSFWKNTYPEVRKELRARYAKHFWPEDPFTATATHLTQKQFQRQNRK